jgi:hypothetical protein
MMDVDAEQRNDLERAQVITADERISLNAGNR